MTYNITGPFLANFIFSFINWYRLENSNKSLIWALLNLYPIYGKSFKYNNDGVAVDRDNFVN